MFLWYNNVWKADLLVLTDLMDVSGLVQGDQYLSEPSKLSLACITTPGLTLSIISTTKEGAENIEHSETASATALNDIQQPMPMDSGRS